MKKIILIFAALLLVVAVQAQSNLVIKQEGNTLVAERYGYGTFTADVRITVTDGIQHYRFPVTAPHQTFQLDGNPKVLSIEYDWIQAAVDSAVDTAFVYTLPFKGCRKATAHALANYDLKIFRGNFRNFRVWQFDLNEGRKVYPVRDGIVIWAEDVIVVEHADGSQAEYSVLNNITVKEGDEITTKTQLGTAGAELDGGQQYMLRVAVYYYESNTNQRVNTFARQAYINPIFATSRGKTQLKDNMKVKQ